MYKINLWQRFIMIVGKINTKDITVIVQGKIDSENTKKCTKSIRKHLPGAHIIVSTWEGEDVHDLVYDEVIYNTDPGGFKDLKTSFVNNMNRQIVSSLAGIKKVNTKYCMKIRNDLILESNNFLKYFGCFPKRCKEESLFENRVIFCSYFFKRYLGVSTSYVHPTPYHLSDWIMFGLTTDLLLLFDIPLAKEPENTNYLITHKKETIKTDMFGASHQYAPEQYIFIKAIEKKFGDLHFKNILDFNSENIEKSNRIIANNCIVLNPEQFRLYCGKNGVDPYREWTKNIFSIPFDVWEGLVRWDVFEKMYEDYCDSEYKSSYRGKLQIYLYKLLNKRFVIWRK